MATGLVLELIRPSAGGDGAVRCSDTCRPKTSLTSYELGQSLQRLICPAPGRRALRGRHDPPLMTRFITEVTESSTALDVVPDLDGRSSDAGNPI